MTSKKKPGLRGLAEPFLLREPLFIRLCSAFVDNLAMILRVALVFGGILLIRELHPFFSIPDAPVREPEVAVVDSQPEAETAPEAEDPVLTPGVLHALNCTHKKYRDEHYDECVKDGSEVYRRPGATPDDAGFIFADVSSLYASASDNAAQR